MAKEHQVTNGMDLRKYVFPHANEAYWWQTTGRDIANMMTVADYPEDTQQAFLSYYHSVVCPLLGAALDASDPHQGRSWTSDGSTHEYSFEFKKGETHRPEVRFVLDASSIRPQRPVDAANPLSLLLTDVLVQTFAGRAPGFDSTWYRALRRHFDYSHLPQHKQQQLVAQAGHASPILIGFDITRDVPTPAAAAPPGSLSMLPVVGKAYFAPCFSAAANKTDRFTAICEAIRSLPDIDAHPNILAALGSIEAYLATKPKSWAGARFLALDFVAPDKSRLKLYLRCPSTDFEDIWDFFTLGGRIAGLEEDKQKYRDFVEMLSGVSTSTSGAAGSSGHHDALVGAGQAMYFSLDDRSPVPSAKVNFSARRFADNDAVIAERLDAWLVKYAWKEGGDSGSFVDQVARVFKHRDLSEKAGIFTFIGLARKNPADKRDLCIQTYMCPELFACPRRLDTPVVLSG